MCQTAVISKSIVNLSKRTFAQRIDIAFSPTDRDKASLSRLNKQLDNLYEILYDSYPTMTVADYNQFAPYLSILLKTLKELLDAYKKSGLSSTLKSEIAELRSTYSALLEIESDIINFKINIPKNEKFQSLMAQIKAV